MTNFRARALVGGALVIALAGCRSGPDALDGTSPAEGDAASSTSCPNDFHAQCPIPAPSYQSDILPIVQAHCLTCHAPSGLEPTENSFTNYQAIFDDRQAIEDQVNDCRMPPVDAGVGLPTTSRVLLMTWLACGAPDN
jgi:hypothetical protein